LKTCSIRSLARALATLMPANPGLHEPAVSGGAHPPETVKVWDPLVRIFHWSLAALFTTAYFTAKDWQSAHEFAGYGIAGLMFSRIGWGFIGSKHARFNSFVYRPATVFLFLRDSLILRAKRYIGHNPAGGAMVIALLSAVSVICATGFMMTTDAFWGIDWVGQVHEAAVYSTIALVVLHLIGVGFASFEHSENLVKSMFTGRKRP
jgi:cytochrome b